MDLDGCNVVFKRSADSVESVSRNSYNYFSESNFSTPSATCIRETRFVDCVRTFSAIGLCVEIRFESLRRKMILFNRRVNYRCV